MRHRTVLILSAGLTAFLLVVVGAVAALATQGASGAAAAPTATLDPAIEAQLAARERDYQKALQEANTQLQAAYDKIEELQGGTPTESAQTELYPISPELAVGLALNLSPGAKLLKWPDLVDFRGTAAYEIVLDSGPIYISATDAVLLYDGTVATVSTGRTAFHDDDDEHEFEHEGGEDD